LLPAPPRLPDLQLRPRCEDPQPTICRRRVGADGLEGLVKYVPYDRRPMPTWFPLVALFVMIVVAWALVFAFFEVVF